MTEALRVSGYRTHCVGKIHMTPTGTPNGMPFEEVDPQEFPEAREMWLSGRVSSLPSPYYGLEGVDLVKGNGAGSYGNYGHWLDREHPDEAQLFHDAVPLEPPSPAVNYYPRSFKWALPEELHPQTWAADRTIDYINGAGRALSQPSYNPSGAARPFFLWCSIQEPHVPLSPPAPWCYRHDPKDVPPGLWQERELDRQPPHFRDMYERKRPFIDPYRDECAAHYYDLIEMTDHSIGRVLRALRDSGLEDNTVIILTADHGEALGDHGMFGKGPYHYDTVVRVPFVISWPGRFPPGKTHTGVISLVDFAPTILDLAGVPIPEGPVPPEPVSPEAPPPWPGRSLAPILTGEENGTTGAALIEDDQDALGFRLRTLVTQRYRVTAYSGQPYGELFDFQEDPNEYRNLWDEPGHKAVRDELRLALADKIMETDYPLPRRWCGA